MPEQTNVTIKKAFKGASGEGEYGPWQIWDVYFEGSENKYSYFEKKGQPNPTAGMKLSYLQFEITQKGQYTNRSIKEMKLAEGQETASKAQNTTTAANQTETNTDGNGKAYIDHGKVVLALLEMAGGVQAKEEAFLKLVRLFWQGVGVILESSQAPMAKKTPEQDNEPSWDGPSGDPGPEDDDIPF